MSRKRTKRAARADAMTLWDLLLPRPRARRQPTPPPKPVPPRNRPIRARYDRMTRDMLARYGVRVRRWRTSMSGVAWTVTYRDGSVSRLIEAPRPRGPMSAAIFLHEIGHHAIGVGAVKPRCLEEYRAWAFALETLEAEGFNVTDAVRRRMRDALRYAVAKAKRRGLKHLPPELEPFVPAPR